MITGKLRNDIDKLWEEFWTGGITNPLTVIEQISFLMFARMLDIAETRNEKRAQLTGEPFKAAFAPNKQHLRWKKFRELPSEEMLKVVRDEVLPHFREEVAKGTTVGNYMADATLMIQKASLLQRAVDMIDNLPLTQGDTKGDLYEYLLSKLTTAGINGQFRTPRHIIRFMVEMLAPTTTEVIGDPSCGTGGFLVGAMEYLLRQNTEVWDEDEDGNKHPTGDRLSKTEREYIQKHMFHGFDFDSTMLRISAMNLMLHGVEHPDIRYMDTLSNQFPERAPDKAKDAFDVILANPPFKGSLDAADVNAALYSKVQTKKTELLFVALILRMLKIGGRSATIVPDGVLFGSTGAHKSLRRILLEENQLEAVISLPSGVFKPYAGVSTAILIFTRGGKTDQVLFYDVQGDGFSLDDKREPKPGTDDLPKALEAWRQWKKSGKGFEDKGQPAFVVTAAEIAADPSFDLSINRYQETKYEAVEYDPPKVILERLMQLERDITDDLKELGGML